MTTSTRDKFEFTRAEAAKWIKRALPGTKFALHVRIDARIADDPEHYIPSGCVGHISLSRAQALDLVKTLLDDKGEQERGKRIPCSKYENEDRSYVCYWIG